MALRKLAGMLASAGFHVLRFDYFGTGDSAGGSTDGSLTQWTDDIVAAVTDLKERSSATKVSLVGFRLGATLAARAPIDVAKLVLLEPVVSGRRHLDELRDIHIRKFSNLLYPPPLPEPGRGGELLGMPFPAQLEREIAALDLTRSIHCRAGEVILLSSSPVPELQAQLQAASKPTGFGFYRIPEEARPDHDQALLLPPQVLEHVTSALSRRVE